MKMKNNKMFLALVVVAALAMVSVAGVAVLSDNQSDASTAYVSGNVTINSDTGSVNFNIKDTVGGTLTASVITITDDAGYTGTIQYGTYTAATGTAAESYVAVFTITLTDVSNAVINIGTNGVATITTPAGSDSNLVTSGDLHITLGSITLGSAAYFAGTVSGNTATLVSQNTYGTVLTAGTTDKITGTIHIGGQYDLESTPALFAGKLTVSGTATLVETTEITADVEVVIADGAEISSQSAGDYKLTYVVTSATSASTATAVSGTTTINGVCTAGKVVFNGLDPTKEYSVTIIVGTTLYFGAEQTYSSTASTLVASKITTIDSSAATGGLNVSSASGNTLSHYSTDVIVSAKAVSQTTGISYVGSGSSGDTLVFTNLSSADVFDTTIVMKNAAGSAYYFYIGEMTTTGTSTTGTTALAASGDALSIGTISIGSSPTTILNLSDVDSKLTVDGTLKMVYKNASINGDITNSGEIDVTGMIEYQVVSTRSLPVTTGINAVYYKATGTSIDTYYYTTLTKSMASASEMTVIGTIVIEADTELTGTSTTANIVNIAANSYLVIGVNEDMTTTPVVEAATVIVTVPTTTTLNTYGQAVVVNGQLKIAELASDSGYSVNAAVFMTDSSYGTYTDLATALGLASSGDIVKLRQAAIIAKNVTATVSSGVTLNTNSYGLTVDSGAVLTVNGKFIGSAGYIVVNGITTISDVDYTAGELIINSAKADVSFTTGTITIKGILTIGADSEVVFTNGIATTGASTDAPAVINVYGKVTIDTSKELGTASTVYSINVTGTLLTKSASSILGTTGVTMIVSGTFTAASTEVVGKLTVTGFGKVSATANAITVSNLIVGTAPTDMSATVNNASVKITLANNGTAVVYGTPAENKVIISGASTPAVSTFYIGSVVFAKEYTVGTTAVLVLTNAELTGLNFTGWYNAPINGTIITANTGGVIGSTGYKSVYGYTTVASYTITLSYQEGVTYVLDGVNVGSSYSGAIAYGAHTLTAQAASGYKGTVTITMTGATLSSGKFTATQDVSVTSTGVSKDVVSGGWTITDILLVIMVIIIAVIAVVVILKLMRS